MNIVQRNSKGLIDTMFDEIDNLNNGKTTPQHAKAKASVAGTIIQLARLEMDFARFVTQERSGSDGLKSITLGNGKSIE